MKIKISSVINLTFKIFLTKLNNLTQSMRETEDNLMQTQSTRETEDNLTLQI